MKLSQLDIQNFLSYEARLLDDKDWDRWVQCYRADVEFWMPAWDDDGTLISDPKREISLIYYPNRGGLEDRVFRIKTDRSSATSLPEPRTSHNISNIEILEKKPQSNIGCALTGSLSAFATTPPIRTSGPRITPSTARAICLASVRKKSS